MPQISLTSSDDDDKSYEQKKLKKACKKVKSITDWMLHKSSMSVDDCKAFWKELNTICFQVKHKPSSINTSPGVLKGSPREVSLSDKDHCRLNKELCVMEMPLVDNGNMKCFHKAFRSYFPCLLMFKEKYGHLQILGDDDPKKEWPGLQQWLKNIRATMSKYDRSGSGRFAIEPMYYDLLVSMGVSVHVHTKPL
jgi:hypothetical protein